MAPKYPADTIPVCLLCDKRDETKVCKKCAIVYCKHFTSSIDIQYCANCISDFVVKETIMEKMVERQLPDGTITFSRKYQARHIQLIGNDWLFQTNLIPTMSDEELLASIEYHRANKDLMILERESRKQERIRKLAGIKLPKVTRESQETREKREAKAALSKDKVIDKDITADALMKHLTKLGLKPEDILRALGGK